LYLRDRKGKGGREGWGKTGGEKGGEWTGGEDEVGERSEGGEGNERGNLAPHVISKSRRLWLPESHAEYAQL